MAEKFKKITENKMFKKNWGKKLRRNCGKLKKWNSRKVQKKMKEKWKMAGKNIEEEMEKKKV